MRGRPPRDLTAPSQGLSCAALPVSLPQRCSSVLGPIAAALESSSSMTVDVGDGAAVCFGLYSWDLLVSYWSPPSHLSLAVVEMSGERFCLQMEPNLLIFTYSPTHSLTYSLNTSLGPFFLGVWCTVDRSLELWENWSDWRGHALFMYPIWRLPFRGLGVTMPTSRKRWEY